MKEWEGENVEYSQQNKVICHFRCTHLAYVLVKMMFLVHHRTKLSIPSQVNIVESDLEIALEIKKNFLDEQDFGRCECL